jgi:hypothetical protein
MSRTEVRWEVEMFHLDQWRVVGGTEDEEFSRFLLERYQLQIPGYVFRRVKVTTSVARESICEEPSQ